MSKISVVINTLNEEKNLPGALASVKSQQDSEVVVPGMIVNPDAARAMQIV